MITRPPLRYDSPRQIVRLAAFGFNVPLPVLWYAEYQLPVKPAVEYAPIDWYADDKSEFDTLNTEIRADRNANYDMRKDLGL